MALRRASRPSATTIRSQLVLELAAGLVAVPQQPLRQTKVLLREQGMDGWPLSLFASSTKVGIEAVAARETALAIMNPSAALTLAYRGNGSFAAPQPVRVLTVIPSHDQYVFAVKGETGLTQFEQIAERRYPLRIGVRGQRDHYLHEMLDHVAAAAGFTLDDVKAWGGDVRGIEFSPPRPGGTRLTAVADGELDAIFDEGASGWVGAALEVGMTMLPLAERTVRKLEAMGYRRSALEQRLYPKLARDVTTLDFSGWPVFVHADLPEQLVAQMCAALDERKALIPWEGDGPLPIERMCRDGIDTPLDVPLHPGAERFWTERGYLR